jgi:enoyl-[acyl-carrier protein] reductase II
MRLLRNRAVTEWNHRLAEVPTERDHLPVIGTTVLGGQPMELRKFNVLLPIPETQGDWEEMPFLAGQAVGLVRDVAPAEEVVHRMMAEAQALLRRGAAVRA